MSKAKQSELTAAECWRFVAFVGGFVIAFAIGFVAICWAVFE